jgi:hypothetical protein
MSMPPGRGPAVCEWAQTRSIWSAALMAGLSPPRVRGTPSQRCAPFAVQVADSDDVSQGRVEAWRGEEGVGVGSLDQPAPRQHAPLQVVGHSCHHLHGAPRRLRSAGGEQCGQHALAAGLAASLPGPPGAPPRGPRLTAMMERSLDRARRSLARGPLSSTNASPRGVPSALSTMRMSSSLSSGAQLWGGWVGWGGGGGGVGWLLGGAQKQRHMRQFTPTAHVAGGGGARPAAGCPPA